MTEAERIKKVAKVLKKHFSSLNVEQTIDISAEIIAELTSELRLPA